MRNPRSASLTLALGLMLPLAVQAAPGELDCTFGSAGKVMRQLGAPEAAHDVGRQSDGRLVTLGGTDPWNSSADTVLRLSRFRSDGALDTAFGSGGSRTHVIAGQPLWRHLAVDSQDRLIVAGTAAPYDSSNSDVMVARFLPDGSLDASFGSGGSLRFSWSAATTGAGSDNVGALAIDAQDRPVIVGTADPNGNVFNPSNADVAVARLTADGALDAAFGSGGIHLLGSPGTSHDDNGRGVAIDSQGRIVVAALTAWPNTFNSGPRNTLVARLDVNGQLDPAFDGDSNGNGVLILDMSLTGEDDFGWDVAVGPDDRAVVMASVGDDPALARLLDDGRLDTSFSGDGVQQQSFLGGQDVLARVLVQPDGRPIVTGWPVASGGRFRFAAMRFTTAGVLDAGWGTNGVAIWNMRTIDRAYGALLQPDGKLVLAGGLDNDTWFGMARLRGDHDTLPSTTTTLQAILPSPSALGDAVTVSYSVIASDGTPAGTVTVSDGVDSCSASVAAGSCSLVLSTAGPRALTASYGGGGCHAPSTSAEVSTLVGYRITAQAGAGGSITPEAPQLVAPGAQTVFTLMPDEGMRIASVSGCGGSLDGSLYTIAPATAHCQLTASFAPAEYMLTYVAGAHGQLQGELSQTVAHGGSGTPVTAVGDTGWRFAQWSDGSLANPRVDGGVTASIEVTASFAPYAVAHPGTLVLLEDNDAQGQLDGISAPPRTHAIVQAPQHGELVAFDADSGAYTYRPHPDFNGSDSFTFTVAGAGVTSAPATLQIEVAAVNDAPSFQLGVPLPHPPASIGAQQLAGFAQFDAGPDDEQASQSPQWLVTAVDDPLAILVPGSVAIAADGTLSYDLAGHGGEAEVSVTVRDDGGTTNGGIDTAPAADFVIAVQRGADLQVAKDNGVTALRDGQAVVYAIVVANAGPDPVSGARLRDVLPASLTDAAWQCDAAGSSAGCPPDASGSGDLDVAIDLPVGTHLQFDLSATVAAASGSFVVNRAQVTPPDGVIALQTGNDSSTDSDPVVPDGVFRDGFEAGAATLTVPAALAARQRRDR